MTTGCVKAREKMKNGFQKLLNSDDDGSVSEEEVLPVRITYLTPALIEEARTQLNETEENRQKGFTELRRMIKAEPKLHSLTDDLFLLAFLRARKFKVKKAFKLLQNYWSFRKEYNKIYDFTEAGPVIDAIMRNFIGLLPHRDRKGCLVFIVKIGQWDPEIDSYENIFRAITSILVYSMEHEATQIAGFRVIVDTRGLSWKQLRYSTPANILLLIRSTQFCFPARYKGIHVLHENRMLNIVWAITYPFLTPKLKRRIFFHGEDLKPLTEYIHPSVLSEEFGGKAPPFENSQWRDIIINRVETVLNMLNYGYKDCEEVIN